MVGKWLKIAVRSAARQSRNGT